MGWSKDMRHGALAAPMACVALLIALACALALAPAPAHAVSPGAGGWYWPTGHGTAGRAPGWLSFRTWYSLSPRAWHLAWDDCGHAPEEPVYALSYGEVVFADMHVNGYGWDYKKKTTAPGGAIIIRYRTADGIDFKALYGHVDFVETSMSVGTTVTPGQKIAATNHYASSPHVHFGIRPGLGRPVALPWTKPAFVRTVSSLMGHTFDTTMVVGVQKPEAYGWVDPARFLRAHTPETPVPARPSRPVIATRVARGHSYVVTGTFAPTKVSGNCPITLVGERLENGTWVPRGSWKGMIKPASVHRAHYSVKVSLPSRGTWRLRVEVASRAEWTAGNSSWTRTLVR
jgi:hypothetical protein